MGFKSRTRTALRFELFKDTDAPSEWRWRLKAANNEIVAASEGYKNKQDALDTIELIKSSAATAPIRNVT